MQKAPRIWNWLLAATLAISAAGAGFRFLHTAGGEAVWPIENGARWLWRGVSYRAKALWRAQESVARLRHLEDEVEQLRLDARALEDLAAENRELRSSLGLPPQVLRRPLKCEAISWGGAAGWWRSLKINQGSRAGVRAGDAVVCADGLVGRVRQVYSDASDVMLLTDPNCRVACALVLPEGLPTVRGIIHGEGWKSAQRRREASGDSAPAGRAIPFLPVRGDDTVPFLFVADPMRLEYLDRAAIESGAVTARTRVTTSGLSGSIPGGIPVGWLVSARLDGDGLYGSGEVIPAVDFASLRAMAVLVGGEAGE